MVRLLLLFALCGFAAADEPAALSAARSEYESRLAPFRQKLDAAIQTRTEKYVADLKGLEDRLAASGQLDPLLVIRAEREAYEKGLHTSGFDPKNRKIPAAARPVRAAFDSDIVRIRTAALPDGRKLAAAYAQQLESLERKLTMQSDIPAAVAVREERARFQQNEMDPLNPASNILGEWSYAQGKDPSKKEKTYIFQRDGTWKYPNRAGGKWKWTDRTKRKLSLDYTGGTRIDEYILSPDGMHLVGHDDSGTPTYLDRLP